MTILICGASGLVGKELACLLDQQNIKFVGTYNSNKIDKPNMFKIDFKNSLETINLLVFSFRRRNKVEDFKDEIPTL